MICRVSHGSSMSISGSHCCLNNSIHGLQDAHLLCSSFIFACLLVPDLANPFLSQDIQRVFLYSWRDLYFPFFMLYFSNNLNLEKSLFLFPWFIFCFFLPLAYGIFIFHNNIPFSTVFYSVNFLFSH